MCRSKLYRVPQKQTDRDLKDVERLRRAHTNNPYYGVARLAIVLGWSENKTRRIRTLAGVTIKYSKKPSRSRLKPEITAPDNLLKSFWEARDPRHPEKGYTYDAMTNPTLRIWVQDFTYIWWKGRFWYLAVTMSLATRQVLGWSLGYHHTADLVYAALENALLESDASPDIIHSDRGAEYMSKLHAKLCAECNIRMSASEPGSPTQNGFMESFFSSFKAELKCELSRANSLDEFYERIALWIYYYNHIRIHTALKMSPIAYARTLQNTNDHQLILPAPLLK